MNKSKLIDELATLTGYKPGLTDKMVRIFFDRIKVALKTGDKVEIRGFGSFTLEDIQDEIPKQEKKWKSNQNNYPFSGQAKTYAAASIGKFITNFRNPRLYLLHVDPANH